MKCVTIVLEAKISSTNSLFSLSFSKRFKKCQFFLYFSISLVFKNNLKKENIKNEIEEDM